MCHWNEMYWEIYLSDQINTQTIILLKKVRPRRVFGQNEIDITRNNDPKVNVVKQLMTGHLDENDTILLFLWLIRGVI